MDVDVDVDVDVEVDKPMPAALDFPKHVCVFDAKAGEARALADARCPCYGTLDRVARELLSVDWPETPLRDSACKYGDSPCLGFGALRVLNVDSNQAAKRTSVHLHCDRGLLLTLMGGPARPSDTPVQVWRGQ